MPRTYVKKTLNAHLRHNWKMPAPNDVRLRCHDCDQVFDLIKHLDAEAWEALAQHMKRCRPKMDASAFLKALKRTEQTMRLRVVGSPFPTPQDAEERYFPSSARDIPDGDDRVLYGDGQGLTKLEQARR